MDADDIAAVAAAALTEDGHTGKRYELTGPRALSFAEALEIIGRASGRSVRFRGTDETTWPRRLPSARPRSRHSGRSRRLPACGSSVMRGPPASSDR